MSSKPRLKIRIAFEGGHIGPGKIRLLEKIMEKGSISGAAKEMGMTYRRAWHLIETLQSELNVNVIETSVGGKKGGGANVTPYGRDLITLYRESEAHANASSTELLEKMDEFLSQKISLKGE